MGVNDPLIKSDPYLGELLNKAIDNNDNPQNIDLTKFPWEQDTRHFYGYIFVVNSEDPKSFDIVELA
jgi:hypothetical protein